MGCCDGKQNADATREVVRQAYSKIAAGGGSCCAPKKSCGCGGADTSQELALGLGYMAEELSALPEGANLGLSCGNPVALAGIRAGENVLDLGAGAGFDVFLAAARVGAAGRAIGVDMTAEMVAKARANAAVWRERGGLDNVEFRLGEIEHLPVADASIDLVISNCVINLSPRKPQVWREIARVLKPGGRAAVSDMALLRPLPEAVRESVQALVGCLAGAVLADETRARAEAAGLTDIVLTPRADYSAKMTEWKDPMYREIVARLGPGRNLGDYVTSLSVTAKKPLR